MRGDRLRQMTPTENWLWAYAEARQDHDTHKARLVAGNALQVWRLFMASRKNQPTV